MRVGDGCPGAHWLKGQAELEILGDVIADALEKSRQSGELPRVILF